MNDTNMDVCSESNAHKECLALASILMRIGDKWTVMVAGALSNGSMRYTEIFKQIDGVTQRMLTLTLKSLERDGLVTRTVYPTFPPRTDYALTKLGRTLIEPLSALSTWARAYHAAVEESRREFDQRRQPLQGIVAP